MTDAELFYSINEPFAAGLFENPEKEPIFRFALAYKRYWEAAELTPYDGGMLYPCGKHIKHNAYGNITAVVPDFSYTYHFKRDMMKEKSETAYEIMLELDSKVSPVDTPHTVGGAGYTHSFPNYSRLLNEGLKGYEKRITELPDDDFKYGLLILLDGIRIFHKKCLDLLVESRADDRLIAALRKVPENPPENIYEALVAWNFIYYIDGCDDIGALDRNLIPYYKGEDITPLLKELFSHVDINDGWSAPLGPDYNEITVQCIRAIHNGRRPNLQLLVKEDMPDSIWQEVYASLATSCGQPALYNYDLYISQMKKLMPQVGEEDLNKIAFGGCTETMIEGCSNVGSDDAGINTALVLDNFLQNDFINCNSFEEFEDKLCAALRDTVIETLNIVNEYRRTRSIHRPHPVRTFLIDDCISNRKDFNSGGARYYWSVANVAGLINVIDSVLTIKYFVYDKKIYSPTQFITNLNSEDDDFFAELKKAPVYGVDDDEADKIGYEIADAVYSAFDEVPCYPSGRYYPVSNQFSTYVDAGKGIGPTPDGRHCNAPLCDSMGAIHGNDTKGPTALLNSAAKLPLKKVIGTPIMNIRIKKEHLSAILKPLVTAFFNNEGMQLQVSCLSREEMLDAIEHPEEHKSLVVRVGGFSEYFNRLSHEMKLTILERTEY